MLHRKLGIVGALGLLAGPILAQTTQPVTPEPSALSVEKLVGVWELISSSGMSCRMQLRLERVGDAYAVGAPPACKRAIPVLTGLSRWSVGQDALALMASDGRVILAFDKPDGEGVRKVTAGGQDYALKPVSLRVPEPRKTAVTQRPGAITVALPSQQPASGAPKSENIPGTYLAYRLSGPSDCRIQLLPAQSNPDRRPAVLEPGCADAGLIVFNPVAWRYAEGRLILIAAKGHDISLVFNSDGSFRKDPPSGAELRLKSQ